MTRCLKRSHEAGAATTYDHRIEFVNDHLYLYSRLEENQNDCPKNEECGCDQVEDALRYFFPDGIVNVVIEDGSNPICAVQHGEP